MMGDIDSLVTGSVRHEGNRIISSPFASREELSAAWAQARCLLPAVSRALEQSRVFTLPLHSRIRYIHGALVLLVTTCLVLRREYGDGAFSPFPPEYVSANAAWKAALPSLLDAESIPHPVRDVMQTMVTLPESPHKLEQIRQKLDIIARSPDLSSADQKRARSLLEKLKRPSKKNLREAMTLVERWAADIMGAARTNSRAE
jgi:hypothetical protein